MNILISTNDGYMVPTIVMLTSLFKHNATDSITIFLLYDNLSTDSLIMITNYIEENGAVCEAIKVKSEYFTDYSRLSYISVEAYFRVLAAYYLPSNIERVLWLDSDMIINGDLQVLYNINLGNNAFAACAHSAAILEKMSGYWLSIGLNRDDTYINSGVLLINLEAFRKKDILTILNNNVNTMSKLKYADQDLLNIIFKGQIEIIDSNIYNLMTNDPALVENYRENPNEVLIIHYLGRRKPWKLSDVPLRTVWDYYYNLSPYSERPLNRITQYGLSSIVERAIKFKSQTKEDNPIV